MKEHQAYNHFEARHLLLELKSSWPTKTDN